MRTRRPLPRAPFTSVSPSTSTAALASRSAFSVSGSGSPAAPPLGASLTSASLFSGSVAAPPGGLWTAGRGRSS